MHTVLKHAIRLLMVLAAFIMLAGVSYCQDNYQAYVIKAGEDLTVIAEKFHTSVQQLTLFNRNLKTDELHPGDMMRVPVEPQTPVAVQPTVDGIVIGGAAGNIQINNYLQPQPTPQPQPLPQPVAQVQPPIQEENGIIGVIGKVSIDTAEIRSEPAGGGRVLFSRTLRDTELLVTDTIDNYYGVAMADGSTGWILQTAVALTNERKVIPRSAITQPQAPVAEGPGHQEIVAESMKYLGIPYQLGGKLPNTVDCSLFVQTVFSQFGYKLPRTAAEQFNIGMPIEFTDLQPGDRLYFYKSATSNIIGHTGIYIGNGQFIHASSNRGKVAIDQINECTSYWNKLAGARR